MNNLELLSKNLRKIRQKRNITIKEMSEMTKIPYSFLINADKLNVKRIKLIYLDRLCFVFNISISNLFD